VNDEVPFMEKVFPIKKEKHAAIPAVTHVDGTGRLQTVDKNVTPRYYNLIEAFRRKTGVPILLNTSFNENEPIVNSPKDALECYLRTNMDMLVLENCVISRNG
jgi:carbamoyltransferase